PGFPSRDRPVAGRAVPQRRNRGHFQSLAGTARTPQHAADCAVLPAKHPRMSIAVALARSRQHLRGASTFHHCHRAQATTRLVRVVTASFAALLWASNALAAEDANAEPKPQ